MKKTLVIPTTLFALGALALIAQADMEGELNGKAEFAKHCAVCHVDGGNVVNPAKTLRAADREKNGVKSWQDIVAKMRNPGPGMTKFDEKEISAPEAKAIAEYILATFK
jgi:cytochrome c6